VLSNSLLFYSISCKNPKKLENPKRPKKTTNICKMSTTTTASFASASLYVGDLRPDINESQLFEIFKQIGPVASIRVCRDAITRRSLGYAYVNYHSVGDAERALDVFNFKDIKGKPCRIMWSQRDPALRKSHSGNIFIKNVHKSIDNKALYDTFASFGNILSCKVATDENGVSKGYAFVHYDTQEAADLAIEKVNGLLLNGKKVFVGNFVSRKERRTEVSPKWTNIYVKHLDKSVDEEKLKTLFSPYGRITSAVIMRDEANESKGFGFINFETHEEAEAALALNEKEFEGKQLYVGRAQKKSEREVSLKDMFQKLQAERMSKYQGVNLYVKNLEDTIDDEKLRKEFSRFGGTITSAKVMKDEKGVSKGFGFVCFATPEEATKAVTEMNGTMIGNKPIYVALAQRKEIRRQQLANHPPGGNRPMPMVNSGMYPPVFYPPGRGAPFVYPGMYNGRGRYPPNVPMPGYVMGGRGKPRGKSSGGKQQQGAYPIKYNSNVRNPTVNPTPTAENAQDESNKKMMLGENLYPRISVALQALKQEALSGKITGMLLDSMSPEELYSLIESPEALNRKIAEALEVLEQYNKSKDTNAATTPNNATPPPAAATAPEVSNG